MVVACARCRSATPIPGSTRAPVAGSVQLPEREPSPGIDIAKRLPVRDSSRLIVCPPQPPQYGDGRVEERLASRGELNAPKSAFRVVTLLVSSYPSAAGPMPEAVTAVYDAGWTSGGQPIASARTDSAGRAVLDWKAPDTVNIFARAIGYARLSHPFRARQGYTDTLVFWMRTDIISECY